MKTRDQIYEKEALSLLRDLSMYRCLTKNQIRRLYPEKARILDNLLTYLEYHKRIWRTGDCYFASEEDMDHPKRGLSAALQVMLDFADNTEYHSISDFPAQIIFFADQKVYEIVYVEPGREALISHLLQDAKEQDSNYILIVEKLTQIDKIKAPNIRGFCTVSKNGEVQYYQRE